MKPLPFRRRSVRQIAARLLLTLFVAFVLSGTLVAAERQTVSAAGPLYRAYRFRTQPELNPETVFMITELEVPNLWPTLGVQLFVATGTVNGGFAGEDPFLCIDGVIHPFVNSLGGGVLSGAVAGNAFYYSYSWGSGIHRSLVGRLTIKDGRPIQQESMPLFDRDMVVEKSGNGRVRVSVARWKAFNRWEDPVPLGWISAADSGQLKLVDDQGTEVALHAWGMGGQRAPHTR